MEANETRWANGSMAASAAALPKLYEDVLAEGPGTGPLPASAGSWVDPPSPRRQQKPSPAPTAPGSGGRPRGYEKILHGLAGSRRLAQAQPAGDMAFAQWTGRVAAQSEFEAARELAGLPDASLTALAADFERTPRRRRTDLMRLGYPLALAAIAVVALCGLGYLVLPGRGEGLAVVERLMLLFLGAALVAVGLGNFGSFKYAALDVAHDTLGMYVSVVDDQHPWLYNILLLMNNKAANDYRLKVLAERGQLRGMDYPMMREIASVNEALQLTQTAHGTARSVQASGPGVHVGGLGKAGKMPLAALPKRVNGLAKF